MSPTALESRFDRLERQHRRQRWLLFGVPLLALVLRAAMADWKGKSVTTETLTIVDGEGKERASFASGTDGAQLILRDVKGRIRVRTIADYEGKGPAFFLINDNGEVAAVIRSIDHGPVMALCNEDGKHLVAIGKSTGNGIGFLEFYDDNGNLKGGYGGTGFNK